MVHSNDYAQERKNYAQERAEAVVVTALRAMVGLIFVVHGAMKMMEKMRGSWRSSRTSFHIMNQIRRIRSTTCSDAATPS